MEGGTILKYFIAVTDNLVSLFFIIGVTFGLFSKQLKNKIFWAFNLIVGIVVSFSIFIMQITRAKETNIGIIKFNRQIVVLLAGVLIVAIILGIIDLIIKKEKSFINNLYVIFISLVICLSIINVLPQVLAYTREFVYFGEKTISTMSLLRCIGFILGIVLSLIIAISMTKVASSIDCRIRKILVLFSLLMFEVSYFFRSVMALSRLKILKPKGIIFQIMIVADNYHNQFIYMLLLVGFIACIYVAKKNSKVVGEFKNSALFRKEKARLRNNRRWGYTLCASLFMVIFTLTYLYYYDNKEVELAKPEDYEMIGNNIIIDLANIDDGHLHRFSYQTPNGYDVRFLAVKKPQGNAYGVGLDACEICGVAGYFERGEDVVCKRCDVVMNKATIGFKGGCNPIVFPYEIKESKIIIDKRELEDREKKFK